MIEIPRREDASIARLVRVPLNRDKPLERWRLDFLEGNEAILEQLDVWLAEPDDTRRCIVETAQALNAVYEIERMEQSIPVRASAMWYLEARSPTAG